MNDPISTMRVWSEIDAEDCPSAFSPDDTVELLLLVTGWQREALERVAGHQGLTIGQLLRRLIAVHVSELDDVPWNPSPSEGSSVLASVCK